MLSMLPRIVPPIAALFVIFCKDLLGITIAPEDMETALNVFIFIVGSAFMFVPKKKKEKEEK